MDAKKLAEMVGCLNEDCEFCWVIENRISVFHPDTKLCCHCGWLHPVGTPHRPDDGGAWAQALLEDIAMQLPDGTWVDKP